MSVDRKLMEALTPLGIPVANGVYVGQETEYFVFNYDVIGADFGDDAPQHERYLVQVHYFAPVKKNVRVMVLAAQNVLEEAGFTRPEVTNADDAETRHRVLECEIAEGVER